MPKRKRVKKEIYQKVGNHSAVQICNWTKKSLRDEGVCFKEEFYGIKSHLCCQMTPSLFCNNRCIHCWRDLSRFNEGTLKIIDNPKKIIEGAIQAQRKLLTGFKVDKNSKRKQLSKANQKKFEEAQNPKHFAISLTGEPTLYPKLPELIKEIKKRKATSFVVTNGLQPESIKKLMKEGSLPTRIVVTVNSSNEREHRKFHRSLKPNAWKHLMKTLSLLSKMKGNKTVFRINLIRGINMDEKFIPEFVELIKKTKPFIIGIKAYMSVGFARERLGYEKMPTHKEMLEWIKKLESALDDKNYKLVAVHEFSRYYILSRNKKDLKITDN